MSRLLIAIALLITSVAGDASDDLGWMAGCWQSHDGNDREVWGARNANELHGFAVTMRDNVLAFYEVLSLKRGKDSVWVYTAWPSGQEKTQFRAESTTASSVKFSNPEHDYPQHIAYVLDRGALVATIAGDKKNGKRTFTKIPCQDRNPAHGDSR